MVNVNKIKNWLNETGVKDVEFAKMTGISDPGIRKILAGGDTKLSTIFKIAKAMNVSVHEIICDNYKTADNDVPVASEPSEKYYTKSEFDLLRQVVNDQKEINSLLKEKLKRLESK